MNTAPDKPDSLDVHPLQQHPNRPGHWKKHILLVAVIMVILAAVSAGADVALQRVPNQHLTTIVPTSPPMTPTQAPDPGLQLAHQIAQMISRMSLQEELGQLIVVAFNETTLTPDLRYMIANQHAGGVMLYARNIVGYTQAQQLDAASQAQAKIPLFIATDQEGGLVNRLQAIIGPQPSALQLGNTNDPAQARAWGVKDGQVLQQIGINLDLAPVVDVHSTPKTIILTRMFGDTPAKVATFAGAFLDGLQSQGVIGCLKHWPGLGSSPVDPHDVLPVISRSQQELNAIDFAPYRTLIHQGDVNMIMSTHELINAYDDQMPSSLSPILINQVLRQDLGYHGVVMTDALYMGALARWSLAQAAVLAVVAGNDLLLGSWNSHQVQLMLDALQAAVTSGQISKARIDLSVQRILALKVKEGLLHIPAD